MTLNLNYRPAGFHTITPYLSVVNAPGFIAFLIAAFGAAETEERTLRPDGSIMHSCLLIGDSLIELSEATAEWPATVMALHLYVPDVDAAYAAAVAAGATVLMPPTNQVYNDRDCALADAWGNRWYVGTHLGR